ncbi:MAG: hypothetical protein ACP5XB_03950 [Isosphaeraceae bacterium]
MLLKPAAPTHRKPHPPPSCPSSIAYMLERKPMALAAAGVLLGVILTRLPTALRLRGWLDRQTEILLEERQTLA